MAKDEVRAKFSPEAEKVFLMLAKREFCDEYDFYEGQVCSSQKKILKKFDFQKSKNLIFIFPNFMRFPKKRVLRG